VLNFYQTRGRIFYSLNGKQVSIRIPKFIDMASNYTKRTESLPTEAPTEAPTKNRIPQLELEEEVEEEKSTPPTPPGGCPEPSKARSRQQPAMSHDEYMEWARKEADELLNNQRPYWETAYPALNLEQEVSKTLNWLEANPKSRKKNLKRFIVNWLTRAQDRGPPRGPGPKRPDIDQRMSIWAKGAILAGAPSERERKEADGAIDVGIVHNPDDSTRKYIQYDQTGGEGRTGQEPGILPGSSGSKGG